MGQTSIAMLNKTGYSMFWNSMWDNKITYNRFLKEDIYINNFFELIFNDNMSFNVFNIKKINIKNFSPIIQDINNHNNLHKYLNSFNKHEYFSSKTWILKYQKWVVLFYFIYMQKQLKIKTLEDSVISDNSNIIIKNYFYFTNKILLNYTVLNKNFKKINF